MAVDTELLSGDAAFAEVVELTSGTIPPFNQGMAEVNKLPEIQRITVVTAAEDLGGYFVAHFMGQKSDKIFYHFDE
eukprot:11596328-Ditylum_brightwellii.AAC.1